MLMIRRDLMNKKLPGERKISTPEEYIDELKDYSALKDIRVVSVDPGMSDLLHCIEVDNKIVIKNETTCKQIWKTNMYRYTQDTRRKETKHKKYQHYIQEMKRHVIDGKNISEWDTELSDHNKKTLDFNKFKLYIKKKNEINAHIGGFWSEYIFRKFKFGSYMRRHITEQRLLNRFEEKFRTPETTFVGIGDWEQYKHRKFKEPIKGKGFRTLLRKAGYQVYLVDEFRTSYRCYACEGKCEYTKKCDNPKPLKKRETYSREQVWRYGLLLFQQCKVYWNRDTNGALNINKIIKCAISGKKRPTYLSRGEASISGVKRRSRIKI